MDCEELVALATEYLEGALPESGRERVEAHLRECDGCDAHLAQLRKAIEVAGTLPPERLPEARIEAILRALA
jgi:anti-sigma factor RsiW